MKIITTSLGGPALDWAVAKCEEKNVDPPLPGFKQWLKDHQYCRDWNQGGPIIEREKIRIIPDDTGKPEHAWWAGENYRDDRESCCAFGKTPLESAMRCYVASKLGDDVEIPEELI